MKNQQTPIYCYEYDEDALRILTETNFMSTCTEWMIADADKVHQFETTPPAFIARSIVDGVNERVKDYDGYVFSDNEFEVYDRKAGVYNLVRMPLDAYKNMFFVEVK